MLSQLYSQLQSEVPDGPGDLRRHGAADDGPGGPAPGIAVEGSRIITGAGEISESTDLAKFKGVNAGSIDESGDYEIFKISEITATGMSGITYFSTRPETWSAGLVDGGEHVERCGVFVDMD